MVDATAPSWNLGLGSEQKRLSVVIRLNGEGKVTVAVWDFDKGEQTPVLFSGTHPAIKKGREFNRVTAVYRADRLEVYVNGIAVCDPLPVPVQLQPAHVGFSLAGRGTAEFRRLAIWSAEGVPTPEERLRSGQVPLKEAPKPAFAWPADALRDGRVPAPDLRAIKPRFNDDFSDPKSGWPDGKSPPDAGGWSLEYGYEKGKYRFVMPTAPGGGGAQAPWGKHSNFALEVTGRVANPEAQSWNFALQTEDRKRDVAVFVRSDGKLDVEFRGEGWSNSRLFGPFKHVALKKPDEFNRVLVVMRDKRMELYINGVAACDPIALEHSVSPALMSIGLSGDKGARVEYERVRIWSADEIPTPEERVKK
jgi:hypothetical protein